MVKGLITDAGNLPMSISKAWLFDNNIVFILIRYPGIRTAQSQPKYFRNDDGQGAGTESYGDEFNFVPDKKQPEFLKGGRKRYKTAGKTKTRRFFFTQNICLPCHACDFPPAREKVLKDDDLNNLLEPELYKCAMRSWCCTDCISAIMKRETIWTDN